MILLLLVQSFNTAFARQSAQDRRMEWWRDARFGMFIHWGLYAIPAGTWEGKTHYGEWIRSNAQIPLQTYDRYVAQFNPQQFNAKDWVQLAKNAGMKYIVITSKHHDGFALFDSRLTDFDVMSTPFHRDILKELAAACKEENIRLCFYHSIMDWHHPDYLPRRTWEKDRPVAEADFNRYITYMKGQLQELLTSYGDIGVLWFDGEWEGTWTHEHGKDLYNFVRRLQPSIIVNNRVDKGRSGMQGLTRDGDYAGDFGTPEQEIPPTGIPGVDWESCMTMNNNWGYNSHDNNWKSAEDLVQKLVDIASKGGNFLLNVGPTASGLFPQPAVERLEAIGNWMKLNSASIYGTSASPFKKLSWGRCTQKAIPGGTRMYLHVFDWPENNKLLLPGFGNQPVKIWSLADAKTLYGSTGDGNYIIDLAGVARQDYATVICMDIKGAPVVYMEPEISAPSPVFIGQQTVTIKTNIPNAVIRYTLDGSAPTKKSFIAAQPFIINQSATVTAAAFLDSISVSAVSMAHFDKVTPVASKNITPEGNGLQYTIYEGNWSTLPDFSTLQKNATGIVAGPDISAKKGKENYAYAFKGWIDIPAPGLYTFYLSSDDGSNLYIDGKKLDNDGLHTMEEKSAVYALAKGYHEIMINMFNKTGNAGLELYWQGPGIKKEKVPAANFYR